MANSHFDFYPVTADEYYASASVTSAYVLEWNILHYKHVPCCERNVQYTSTYVTHTDHLGTLVP